MESTEFDSYTRAIEMLVRQCQMLERRDALLRRFLKSAPHSSRLAADVRKELGEK